MARVIKKLLGFWRLSRREKLWFLEAFIILGFFSALIHFAPNKVLRRLYGIPCGNIQFSPLVELAKGELAWRIGKIVEIAASHTLWDSKCLVQALCAVHFLRWRKIPYVLHLGAYLTGDEAEPMKAHAWVKVGPWFITGRSGHQSYAIVGTFCLEDPHC